MQDLLHTPLYALSKHLYGFIQQSFVQNFLTPQKQTFMPLWELQWVLDAHHDFFTNQKRIVTNNKIIKYKNLFVEK